MSLDVGRWMLAVGCFLLVAVLCQSTLRAESVVNTVHNLSAGGPGSIKATTEQNACVFCHTVHHASGVTPLWNHTMSSVSNYVVYSSARLDSLNITVPQPNGSSRLCLSCHDGTVALGSVSSGAPQIEMQNGVTTMPSGSAANLGTDLSADHPISFVYDSNLAVNDPDVYDPAHLSTTAVKMDSQNRLQCTACHNPHDNRFGSFLVMDNTASALCLVCHKTDSWGSSAHAVSAASVPQAILSKLAAQQSSTIAAKIAVKAPTMSSLGCENCHMNHKAGSRMHLLQSDLPEQNCFVCHSGTTAQKNVASDFQKPSIHPITLNSRSHSPSEDPVNPATRHVVCADCHNPHAATATSAVAPTAPGAIAGTIGVSAAGGVIKPVQKEYELCFRCHADSLARGPALVSRQNPETNTRLQFSAANQSFHPVEAIGKNPNGVPSLIAPWTANSVMYCTDCHNSDSSSKAGGAGANGPHGSIYRPILERNLAIMDFQPESASAYAMCYKCHDRDKLMSNQSFSYHRLHVVDKQTACTTCHDSHGVVNAPHLINFNTSYVTPSSNGRLEYISTGTYSGTCSLTCHGVDHNAWSYPQAASATMNLRRLVR